MSRLAGLFVLVLAGSAFADTAEAPATPPKPEAATERAKPSKFPLRVVKILSESEQVLLFDSHRGRHVLVDVGQTVGDYTVSSISEDEITLAGIDVPVEVVLAAPETKKRKPAKKAPAAADVAPEDPYAESHAKAAKRAPADPYAEEEDDESVREVSAVDGSERPVRATHWGAPKAGEGEKSTTSPLAGADVPTPSEDVAKRGSMSATTDDDAAAAAPDPGPVVAKAPAGNAPVKLGKKEWNAALSDFGALAASIDGELTPAGLELAFVKPGSIFAKVGLMAGDVITAVDGRPLATLDDAADLYARAGSMKSATVQLTRAGKPQTLRLKIQ